MLTDGGGTISAEYMGPNAHRVLRALDLKREGTHIQIRNIGPFSDLFHMDLHETSSPGSEGQLVEG